MYGMLVNCKMLIKLKGKNSARYIRTGSHNCYAEQRNRLLLKV